MNEWFQSVIQCVQLKDLELRTKRLWTAQRQTWCVLHLHDNFFACGLQHHVLGPVVPVFVGLGLVHDLLEHGPLPVHRQRESIFWEPSGIGRRPRIWLAVGLTWSREPGPWQWWRCPSGEWRCRAGGGSDSGKCSVPEHAEKKQNTDILTNILTISDRGWREYRGFFHLRIQIYRLFLGISQ